MSLSNLKRSSLKKTALAAAVSSAFSIGVSAQEQAASSSPVEEVLVKGLRQSIERSMDIKRNSSGVVDSIAAEDLGKFPDLNVAESLQRITGVAIDRSGGEGKQITVRGLGPEYNLVLVNGRQLATESFGREFNFDVLSADLISGADVYKTNRADLQEGGIGATVNLRTARPFDQMGFRFGGSVKGMYETLSEKTAPSAAFLVSNTFADDRFGILFSYSHQERELQSNQVTTSGWRPGQTISNTTIDPETGDPVENILFTNAFIPRNWDQIVDQQKRTRDNAALSIQFAPSEDIAITLDGFISKFEIDSEVTDLAAWFEPGRVGSATIDADTGTLLTFTQETAIAGTSGAPSSDLVSHTRNSEDVNNRGFGLNIEWAINDLLTAKFDASTSSAKNDRAGNTSSAKNGRALEDRDRFSVVGILGDYSYDGTGRYPTVTHEVFANGLPDASLSRMHYNEIGNKFSDEDEITELKADFVYTPDSSVFQEAKFGAYHQEREKSAFQIFGSQCQFCGYGTAAPNDLINFRPFTASNYFPGMTDTFYTFDGDLMIQYLADQGFPVEPTLQNNSYTVEEDITTVYMDFTFGTDIDDMPVTVNAGVRYADTSVGVTAVQSFVTDIIPTTDLTLFSNAFGPANDITEGGAYANFLKTFSVKLEVQEDMVVRFAAYDSITRPTLSQLSPATVFGEPRRQNLTATGGNSSLEPRKSENFDMSYEWYYSDSSMFSLAFFNKTIENLITEQSGLETFVMSDRSAENGFLCSADNSELCIEGSADLPEDFVADTDELVGETEDFLVTRPQNNEDASISGYEVGLTHVFNSGLGVQVNATFVDSSIEGDSNFQVEGIGDSQNLVVFYEKENWQARIAFNNRDRFLRFQDNTNRASGGTTGEPVNTDAYGQVDISASYDINDNVTVFFEGINITEEELVQYGRFENQIYNIENNGSRYALGVRANF